MFPKLEGGTRSAFDMQIVLGGSYNPPLDGGDHSGTVRGTLALGYEYLSFDPIEPTGAPDEPDSQAHEVSRKISSRNWRGNSHCSWEGFAGNWELPYEPRRSTGRRGVCPELRIPGRARSCC